MSKTIWVKEETYHRLDNLRGKRETFDEVVQRLCSFYEAVKAIPDTLRPNHPLTGREPTDARAKETLEYGDRTPKLPYKNK